MELLIKYRGSDGDISERRISDIRVIGARAVVAYCHLRNAERTFVLDRIHSATNVATGEAVADLYQLFNLSRPVKPSMFAPLQTEPPATAELADVQRKKDRRDLFKPFRLEVIMRLAKQRLFELFANVCFNCGSSHNLEMDHHIPQELGGRLVPGNIVVLCSGCNGRKLDRAPESFYSPRQLAALQPLLDDQHEVFSFQFDFRAWDEDREKYLLSLGVTPELVASVLDDENHPMYVGREHQGIGFTIAAGTISKE